MRALQIVDIKDRDHGTATALESATITVQLRGNWDMKAVAPLEEFTRSLQAQARELEAERVIVDMAEVEFINSSCLKSFARWLGSIGRSGEDLYSVTFRAPQPWQRRSLEALKALAGDKVTIES